MKKFSAALIITALLFILSACGGGGGSDAPAEGTITINPSSYTVTFAAGSPETTYTQFFSIVVKDANGIPLNDVDLTISFPWAQPHDDVVQLYDGNTPKNSPMSATTDENGTYILRFDYKVGVGGYTGDLQVTSGSLFKSATFEVTEEEEE